MEAKPSVISHNDLYDCTFVLWGMRVEEVSFWPQLSLASLLAQDLICFKKLIRIVYSLELLCRFITKFTAPYQSDIRICGMPREYFHHQVHQIRFTYPFSGFTRTKSATGRGEHGQSHTRVGGAQRHRVMTERRLPSTAL